MSTLRVTVDAPDAETANEVKEHFFKKLFQHSGNQVIFEVPAGADEAADEIIAFAKDKGCAAEKSTYDDPLEDAAGVDFW